MAVDENGNTAAEGLIDPNCPVFARLNLEFPQASWTAARHAVSRVIVQEFLESKPYTSLQQWAQILPSLLRMQTLHYEVLDLDRQAESLEADLEATDDVVNALS